MAEVTILIGSGSDKDYANRAITVLAEYGIEVECYVASAHRNPVAVDNIVRTAHDRGTKVFIGMAGLAAHLPGVIASKTKLPVIGVPLDNGPLNGMDSLLAISQMPAGVPVATVAVGMAGARNAAHLAARILNVDPERCLQLNIHNEEEFFQVI